MRGESVFFRPGDYLLAIGDRKVVDQLDAMFFASGSGLVSVTTRREGKEITRRIPYDEFEKAGLIFDSMRFLKCRSKCLFCFMDQLPRGLRASLYDKDDDYRLSFLYGNFVTLNDITDAELGRIMKQRLSPLYISVHALDRRIRERIFGRKMKRDIVADLKKLSASGIEWHAQIVFLPGINDGEELENTVSFLRSLQPACKSVAIVPVGLTKHRRGLPRLNRVNASMARRLITWADEYCSEELESAKSPRFLYLADEFYLIADRKLPDAACYGDYPQISNGVGTCRFFLDELRKDAIGLRRKGIKPPTMTIATGSLGAKFMCEYAFPMLEEELSGFEPILLRVPNDLFGRKVGVSGLLAGRDIIRAARKQGISGCCLVLPPNAINHEGLLIDDLTPSDLQQELGVPVHVAKRTFLEKRMIELCCKGAPL